LQQPSVHSSSLNRPSSSYIIALPIKHPAARPHAHTREHLAYARTPCVHRHTCLQESPCPHRSCHRCSRSQGSCAHPHSI
jgi:hypothetical protein